MLRAFGLVGMFRLERLRRAPRYREMRVRIWGHSLRVVDGPSAYWAIRSIFMDGEYAFRSDSGTPRIVDAGANIGLSVLYFKQQHPNSSVIAFEADPHVYAVLQENMHTFGCDGVVLINKAVWNLDGEVQFAADGADGGTLESHVPATHTVTVQATRLRHYLREKIDLLKIDIEGAETEVLEDCADLLGNVRLLFVEYHSRVDRPQSLHRLLRVLADADFRVTVQPVYQPARQPFLQESVRVGMDLQLNIYATRSAT